MTRRSWARRAAALALVAAVLGAGVAVRGVRAEDADAVDDDDIGEVEFVEAEEDASQEGGDVAEVPRRQRAPNAHPLTDLPEAADGVETVHVFPKHSNLVFTAGEPVEVLLGLRNAGDAPLNVSGVMGSLNHPDDFAFYIQNFTGVAFGQVVAPGAEVTLPYTFKPDRMLHPRDFRVALTVFYMSDSQLFTSTFFNKTVDVIEPFTIFDPQAAFLYLLLLSGVAGALLAANNALLKKGMGVNLKSSKRSAPKSAAGDASDWLEGTEFARKKAAPVKRKAAVKK